MKRRAVVIFSMIVVALAAAGCAVSSAPQSASSTTAPEAAYGTMKTEALYRAMSDAPICETHDELVAAAYEYDGGHTADVSGCSALAKGADVKILGSKISDDPNAVQVSTQGHTGWTKSYYLAESATP